VAEAKLGGIKAGAQVQLDKDVFWVAAKSGDRWALALGLGLQGWSCRVEAYLVLSFGIFGV